MRASIPTALENEVLRNPKPSLVDRSVLELSPDKLVPPDIYVDRGLLGATPGYRNDWKAGRTSQGHKTSWCDSHDPDMELVTDAKTRIQELQEEAESLEEAYRIHQQRAVHSLSRRTSPKPFLLKQARPSHHNSTHTGQQDSHHSHQSKSPFSPLSPQRVQSPILVFDDPGSFAPAGDPRLTSSDDYDQLHRAAHTHQSLAEPLFIRTEPAQDESVVSSEHSSTRKKRHRKSAEGTFRKMSICSKCCSISSYESHFENDDSPVAELFPNRRLFLCQRRSCLRLRPLSCSVTDPSNRPPPPPLPTSLPRSALLAVPSSRARCESSPGTICRDFDKDAVKLRVCLSFCTGVAY